MLDRSSGRPLVGEPAAGSQLATCGQYAYSDQYRKMHPDPRWPTNRTKAVHDGQRIAHHRVHPETLHIFRKSS
jgi:hypothetical protein